MSVKNWLWGLKLLDVCVCVFVCVRVHVCICMKGIELIEGKIETEGHRKTLKERERERERQMVRRESKKTSLNGGANCVLV